MRKQWYIINDSVAEIGGYAVYVKYNPYYVDTMNIDATNSFIKYTHQRYYERLKPYFDGRLCGFFTDEPQYANGEIPWSTKMQAEWEKRGCGNLIDELPCLFFELENCGEYRYRYYSVANHLLVTGFMKPIYDWCEAHNCKLTGHMMSEEDLKTQVRCTGGVMPCYEYFHKPGIDHLAKLINPPTVPKQLSSAAAQLGKPTITETFAGCGWNVSLNELKWIAQWQYVNGVADICQHLQGYTLRGLRKRDWPASLFIQMPWFNDAYGVFNKHFTNLGKYLSLGEDAAELLVIHPIKSAYMLYSSNSLSIDEYNNSFQQTVQGLSDRHMLYHFGDEELMKKYAKTDGNRISVGECCYDKVLLPNVITITESTFEILMDFAMSGGKIYGLFRLPSCIDGKKDERIEKLCEFIIPVELDNICEIIDCPISITADNGNVHYTERKVGNKRYIYMANLSDQILDTQITLCRKNLVQKVNLITEVREVLDYETGDTTCIKMKFDKYEDCLLEVTEGNEVPSVGSEKSTVNTITLGNMAEIIECDDNAMTLDYCEYRIDGGRWQSSIPVWMVQRECIKIGRPCRVELKFSFDIKDLTGITHLSLACECTEKFDLIINGEEYIFRKDGYYIDKSFEKSSIFDRAHLGRNEIIMSCEFTQSEQVYWLYSQKNVHESEWNKLTLDSELESIYIVGDFGVYTEDECRIQDNIIFAGKSFVIGENPERVEVSNLTTGGFVFFSGKVKLRQRFVLEKTTGRYVLKLSKLNAPAAKVLINGKEAALITFSPFEYDVTELVADGENILDMVLYSGNRNALGPHHMPQGESVVIAPKMFTAFVPQSEITKEVKGKWTDNYSFVIFGAE